MTQIAGQMNIGKASAHRLAVTLTEHGWLIKNEDFSYGLGPSVAGLFASAQTGTDIRASMRPLLEQLRATTGETIHLTKLVGRHIVYLDQLVSTRPVHSVSQVGSRSPAHCVSPGISQLAVSAPEQVEWFLSAPLARFTPDTITDPFEFRELLAKVKAVGYSTNLGGYRPDVGGVGIAIRNSSGSPVAGLSVCAPVYRLRSLDKESIGSMLVKAATVATGILESGNVTVVAE